MFYGDETLSGLIDHSKHLLNLFENFEDQVGFEDDAEENEEDLDDGTEEAQTPHQPGRGDWLQQPLQP